MLQAQDVTWQADGQAIIQGISLHITRGEYVGLIGPNGSGKSSLLRTIYRVLKPQAGLIHVRGEDIWQLPAKLAAQQMSVVTQAQHNEFDFSVTEMIAMGRTTHHHWLAREEGAEAQLIRTALADVDMQTAGERLFNSLSGGEQQRVLIARALVQQAELLVMDEPTNHLDIRYQLELLTLLRTLPQTKLVALHDLNLAAAYCDRLYLLVKGEVFAEGTPAQVLTPANILKAYGVKAEVYPSSDPLRPRLFFAL